MKDWSVAVAGGKQQHSKKGISKKEAARRRRLDESCLDERGHGRDNSIGKSVDYSGNGIDATVATTDCSIGTINNISTELMNTLDASTLNIMRDRSKWELLKVTIDSGACDHVMPKELGTRFEIFPTEESLSGKNFPAANNSTIANHGAREISGVTDEWVPMADLKFNVADVKRCLASTTKLKKQGYLVVLDEELGEFMVHKETGKRINFISENGTPMLNLWIRKPDEANSGHAQSAQEVQEACCHNTGFLGLGFD